MTFLDRLYIERDELNSKLMALNDFMKTDKFLSLDQKQKSLLIDQQYHMTEYHKILDLRINLLTKQ